MAVKLATKTKRYTGVSSDVKPDSDVTEGSTFHYVDTGEKYIFHNGMWENDLRDLNDMSLT